MQFEQDIENCLSVLADGGLILYPTDTIWGIGCDATNSLAVEKVFRLKQRAESKSLIILLADERDVLKHVAHADLQVFDYLEHVTKPTTIVYDGAIGLAGNLISEDGSIAIRVVNEPFCKHLIKRFRRPIVSTSANISGQPAPASFAGIAKEILSGVDYIVKYRQEENKESSPSAIVRYLGEGRVSVIRS